jgi:hypothetical protein
MARWELDPERVRGVLRAVEQRRTELDEALRETRVSGVVLDVSGGGWPVAAVPAAVEGLLADQVARLTRMRQHIDAGVVGTSLAVAAYEAGQEDMAATFQQQALTAAESGDLAPFVPYLEP